MVIKDLKQSKKTKNVNDKCQKIIPPDGGWGWIIVFSYALNNIVMIPLIFGLGLIYKDLFPILGFTKKEEAILMSTNIGFGMAMGLTHGPLIKIFGYRKIAITGSILFTSGLLSTAFSTNFIHFMITYGLITSFGISLTMSSITVAVNSYFTKKRNEAIAIASVFTGFGPMIMPQIIRFLMNFYTNQETIIILSAITLHCFLASLLLQPVKWHAKTTIDEPNNNNEDKIDTLEHIQDEKIHNEKDNQENKSMIKSQKSTRHFSKFWHQTVEIFDLSLLCDPIYVSMMLGTSIATFGETSFSIFTPFILKDLEFNTPQISILMTTMAAVDLPMRGIGPSISKWLKQSPRIMCLLSLTILIASRTSLIFCTDFSSVFLTAIGLGFARGLRSVFMSLIIPNYIPIERLAHATGIQMVTNAIILFLFGPLIGIIRESSGSYNLCIVFVNIMSFITIIMWTIEIVAVHRIKQRKKQQEYQAVNLTP